MQQGTYLAFDSSGISRTLSAVHLRASIFRQEMPSIENRGEAVSTILLLQHGLLGLFAKHRILSLLDLESGERLELKRARLSHHYFSKQLRTNPFYYQSSGKYFLPSDPLREILVPSGLSSSVFQIIGQPVFAASINPRNRDGWQAI